jgi:hypothetical protein
MNHSAFLFSITACGNCQKTVSYGALVFLVLTGIRAMGTGQYWLNLNGAGIFITPAQAFALIEIEEAAYIRQQL